ncbi:MAG: protein-disulfide reductase DsbD family protein [Flavobacteriaceae bacterium]
MKQFISSICLLLSVYGFSQIVNPVKWELSTEKHSETEYTVEFKAKIDPNWAIYSQEVEDGGPLPTIFTFNDSPNVSLVGNTKELNQNKVTKNDPVFDMTVSKFYAEAKFRQRLKIINTEDFVFSGNIEYMTCDDTKCTYKPDNPFTLEFNKTDGLTLADSSEIKQGPVTKNANQTLYGMDPGVFQEVETSCEYDSLGLDKDLKGKNSLWRIFGLGFLGGLLALLTPCVFPMIPLTVSFFTKKNTTSTQSGLSKAILYGIFIVLVYLILSVPFHLLDSVNPDILNEISTNVWLNIIFFLIFVFFAFSFFGYYELTLPASWTTVTSKGEGIGGVFGVFFMALTLSIVSFSCTGPILGSLLAGSLSSDGGAWQLTAGMGGFGVALGLPFALFAMFPNMLKALPKSGGWLNTTKVVLGFLELALAFKFLSNADLVQHWGILTIEVFLGLWIIIFLALALYVFGKIRFPHDSPVKHFSFFRISSGILVMAFVIYLGSGFRVNSTTKTFTPLTLLSGLAPPVGYSLIYPNDCPNDFNCFKDLKEGISYAQSVNKPILLDFTGYACVNCRKMEEHVWPLPTISPYFEEKYVLISLYVDDKSPVPTDQQLTVKRTDGGVRTLENFGHKWAHFQTEFFQSNSQPYYVLLSPDAKTILTPPVGYTPDQNDYEAFLKCGLESFNDL